MMLELARLSLVGSHLPLPAAPRAVPSSYSTLAMPIDVVYRLLPRTQEALDPHLERQDN